MLPQTPLRYLYADDLHRAGRRPVGVVQRGRSYHSQNPQFGVVMLPEGEVVCLASDDGADVFGCRLDSDRLAAAAIGEGADLVIINRFGRSEADGKGLIDLVPWPFGVDIPVLIAVPDQRFAAWIRFSGGMNVRLACRREALDQWWHAVTKPRERCGAGTFCELVK